MTVVLVRLQRDCELAAFIRRVRRAKDSEPFLDARSSPTRLNGSPRVGSAPLQPRGLKRAVHQRDVKGNG
jgi:hypothetical protein